MLLLPTATQCTCTHHFFWKFLLTSPGSKQCYWPNCSITYYGSWNLMVVHPHGISGLIIHVMLVFSPCEIATNTMPINDQKIYHHHTKIIMLIANTSEDEKQGCRHFTLKCKCELLTKNESSCAFSASYYCQWRKNLGHMPNHASSNIEKTHSGCPGLLVPWDDLLLRYVFEPCKQGVVVIMQIVLRRAADFCQNFHAKLDGAKHWLCIGGRSHRH